MTVEIISHRARGIHIPFKGGGFRIGDDNEQEYIEYAIKNTSYSVEVDVRSGPEGGLWVGHDECEYAFPNEWLLESKLIIHCKDFASLNLMRHFGTKIEFFYHENDPLTMTSKGNIWVHPSQVLARADIPWASYVVLPPITPDKLVRNYLSVGMMQQFSGVCTDFPKEMDKLLNG